MYVFRQVKALFEMVHRAAPGCPARTRSSRPQLELLEDRSLPAAILVTSAVDGFRDGDGVTLREAIMAANENISVDGSAAGDPGFDRITFDSSLKDQTIFLELLVDGGFGFNAPLSITEPLSIQGLGRNRLTIDGSFTSTSHLNTPGIFVIPSDFEQDNGDGGGLLPLSEGVTITDLTLANGRDFTIQQILGGRDGGAIQNDSPAPLTLKRCNFVDNEADAGGAIAVTSNARLTVQNCRFIDNLAQFPSGGAIFSLAGKISLRDSSFSGNIAMEGGAVSTSGSGSIVRCTFDDNTGGALSYTNGGGPGSLRIVDSTFSNNQSVNGSTIDNRGDLILERCTINDNTGSFGGGIANSGRLLAINCTISGNRVSGFGGGGVFNSGTFTAVHCTIIRNVAESATDFAFISGGILSTAFSKLRLVNTIVAANVSRFTVNGTPVSVGNDLSAFLREPGNVIEIDAFFSLIQNGIRFGAEGNILHTPVRLGPLRFNGGLTRTHALLLNRNGKNPALNAGSAALAPGLATDQTGRPRSQGQVDIGAVEAPPFIRPLLG